MSFPTRNCTGWLPAFTLALFLLTACTPPFQNGRFSYKPPPGLNINLLVLDGQPGLWLKSGGLYFSVTQQEIPDGSSLQGIYQAFRVENESRMTRYRFISETPPEFSGAPAMETIYLGFSGEPYVQRGDLWLEKDGWVYRLLCSDPVGASPGLEIPVHAHCCKQGAEFQFKEWRPSLT